MERDTQSIIFRNSGCFFADLLSSSIYRSPQSKNYATGKTWKAFNFVERLNSKETSVVPYRRGYHKKFPFCKVKLPKMQKVSKAHPRWERVSLLTFCMVDWGYLCQIKLPCKYKSSSDFLPLVNWLKSALVLLCIMHNIAVGKRRSVAFIFPLFALIDKKEQRNWIHYTNSCSKSSFPGNWWDLWGISRSSLSVLFIDITRPAFHF